MPLSKQDECIVDHLMKTFYSDPKNLEHVEKILSSNSSNTVSLRMLDYFPNNYAKEKNTIIENVHIYTNYKNVLKGYKKNKFDPFCRGQSIKLYKDTLKYEIYDGPVTPVKVTSEYIITTPRQLNFFKWTIERGIIEFVEENIEDIKSSIRDKHKSLNTKIYTNITTNRELSFN